MHNYERWVIVPGKPMTVETSRGERSYLAPDIQDGIRYDRHFELADGTFLLRFQLSNEEYHAMLESEQVTVLPHAAFKTDKLTADQAAAVHSGRQRLQVLPTMIDASASVLELLDQLMADNGHVLEP
jgi:hypothetical protein